MKTISCIDPEIWALSIEYGIQGPEVLKCDIGCAQSLCAGELVWCFDPVHLLAIRYHGGVFKGICWQVRRDLGNT